MAAKYPTNRKKEEEDSIRENIFKYDLRNPYRHDYTPSDHQDSNNGCSICAVPNSTGHETSLKHVFNFFLWEWKKYRARLIKNNAGIELTVRPPQTGHLKYIQRNNEGSHILKCNLQQAELLNNKFTFHVEVKNVGKNHILLLSLNLLYPYECFQIDDYLNHIKNGNVLQLEQGAVYFFKVHFKLPVASIGYFKMPFVLHFFNESNGVDFDLMRQVAVIVSDDDTDIAELPKSKRIKSNFDNVKNIVPPIDAQKPTKHQIPPQFRKVLELGLNESRAANQKELSLIKEIKQRMRLNYPDKSNYADYFHFVLWMDEIGEEKMISQYNMGKVTLVPKEKKFFELQVNGLAEKRPSLLKNDFVNIKESGSDDTVYQGTIVKILDQSVYIGSLDKEFHNLLINNPGMEVDISFQPNRITYERMHYGAEYVSQKPYLIDSLFPNKSFSCLKKSSIFSIKSEEDVFNKEIAKNPEQRQAVENIVNATSGKYPYIVFGPPGTGKTVTMVEAILQIKAKVVNCNILVCAPSNAACNMLTSKLVPWCSEAELIRVHSRSNSWAGVPADVKPYSNWRNGDYFNLYPDELQNFRIVIATLALSGRYLTTPGFSPQYVFIDEAAQATEPEAVIAIALLAKYFQVVLAGDPKQLGPIVNTKAAKKYYLGVSLLERLMSNELYLNKNPDLITMLRLNFRAHPQVLHLPNTIFYNGQLEAMSLNALKDPIASICIYNKINPPSKKKAKNTQCSAAIEFYAIFSEEKRTGACPSYFNPEEVKMVARTVAVLCQLTETEVSQEDIGVITPYISQVFKIKARLKEQGFPNVEVGTTETFQGREKRIIIISTVRAQKSLLLHDAKYKLGFVKSPQRFNVALTRAMSKLIVIGCPNVLRYDREHWLEYMDYCISCKSYFGAPFDRRTSDTMNEVVQQFNQIKLCHR